MKNELCIDVIIPTYNGLPWLIETINSVLSQTHKNLKLLVVDDGSTDGTKSYVRSIKDPRVIYIHKKNNGQSSARNLGIKNASSPFIAFLDADDIWYPDKLSKQMQVMKDHPEAGLVYGHHYFTDENRVIQRNLRIWEKGDLADTLCGGNIIAGSASMVLIRREVLDKAGAYFREDLVNGEDWELWLRIALITKIDFVPEIIAEIRQHSQSTQANSKRMADGLLTAYYVMKRELPLSKMQRKRLALYCIYHTAESYSRMGKRWHAKKILLKLLAENPSALFKAINWKVYVTFGLFSRVFLGNPLFDAISVLWSMVCNIVSRVIKLIVRILLLIPRRIIRKLLR